MAWYPCSGGSSNSINYLDDVYEASNIYNKGDVVLNSVGELVECLEDGVTGEYNSDKWKRTFLTEISNTTGNISYLGATYNPSETYNEGDVCLNYVGELVKCLEDGITGPYNDTKWERTYLCDISPINSNLANLLWTNPNPTSEFPAQNINLDLSKYTHIIVIGKLGNNNPDLYTNVILPKNGIGGIGYGNNASIVTARQVSVNENGVSFLNASVANNTSSAIYNNKQDIPLKIYGINLNL